jgi:thiamine-monophosphate kinase
MASERRAAHDLGEFGLIERLAHALGSPADGRLVTGIGDDAAAWRAGGAYIVATTDTMVSGVHFLPGRVAWGDVGWKALAVNISDIAAMGATPSFALVTLCIPPETDVGALDELYAGIRECAAAHNVTVAGGDIVSSPVLTITVALCGEAAVADDGSPLLLRRSAARPGDAVAVTGPLGGSGGGLRALQDGRTGTAVEALVRRHMRPLPRTDAGRAAVMAGVRCAIDISDGLVQDLRHLCEASGVGAHVMLDSLPVDPSLTAAYPADARVTAATAGEDYELLLVAPDAVLAKTSAMLEVPLTIVGRIVEPPAHVRLLDASGREVATESAGWDHLKRQ